MHFAVCDDHFVDRKQMERLLGRESDRRIHTTGVLYIDSFGSQESILSTPMIYDAIFMDMTEDGCDAVELANALRADGTLVPIVFCCDKVDYRKSPNLPDNVLFLDKPIHVDELSDMISQLLIIKNSQIKKLEFRNRTDTFYLEEDEIMCAWPDTEREVRLRLFNGEERVTDMNIETFCGNMKDCDCFIQLVSRAVLNMLYVKEISFFKATMLDGKSFRLSFGESGALQKAVEHYKKSVGKNL